MPVHNGIKALLYSDDSCFEEFIVSPHNFGLFSNEEKQSCVDIFAEDRPNSNQVRFQVHVNLQQRTDINVQSLSYMLLIDGRAVSFRNYPVKHAANAHEVHIISEEDLFTGQGRSQLTSLCLGKASCVQLRVIRTMIHSTLSIPVKVKDRDIFIEGQLINATSGASLGKGKHFVVSDDMTVANSAHFRDNLEFPLAVFTWQFKSTDELERRLIIPRSPYKPVYKLLPNPMLFETLEPDTSPASEKFTKGLGWAAIDNLAFEQLDKVKAKDCSTAEVISHASAFVKAHSFLPPVETMTFPEVIRIANLQLQEPIYSEIHLRVLRVLVAIKDGVSYAAAAIETAHEFDETETAKSLGALLDPASRATAELETLQVKEIRALCKQQSMLNDLEISRLPFTDVEMYATKRIMEKRYLQAKLQVLKVLAEERLAVLEVEDNAKDAKRVEAVEDPKESVSDGDTAVSETVDNSRKRSLESDEDVSAKPATKK